MNLSQEDRNYLRSLPSGQQPELSADDRAYLAQLPQQPAAPTALTDERREELERQLRKNQAEQARRGLRPELTFEENVQLTRDEAKEAHDKGGFSGTLEGVVKDLYTTGVGETLNPYQRTKNILEMIGMREPEKDPGPRHIELSPAAAVDAAKNLFQAIGSAVKTGQEWYTDYEGKKKETKEFVEKLGKQFEEKPGETALAVAGPMAEYGQQLAMEPFKTVRESPGEAIMTAVGGGGTGKIVRGLYEAAKAPVKAAVTVGSYVSRTPREIFRITEAVTRGRGKLPPTRRDLPEWATTKRPDTPDADVPKGDGVEAWETMRDYRRSPKGKAKELVEEAKTGVQEIQEGIRRNYDEGIRELAARNPNVRHNVDAIKNDIDEALKDGFKFTDDAGNLGQGSVNVDALRAGDLDTAFSSFTSIRSGDISLVRQAVDKVDKWKSKGSLQDVDTLKQQLRSLIDDAALHGYSTGERAINKMWGVVRDRLKTLPDGRPYKATKTGKGYDEIMDEFDKDSTVLQNIAKNLNLGNQKPETAARTFIQSMRDDTVLGIRRGLIDELEMLSGKPFKAMIAGLETSYKIPKGTGSFMQMLSSASVAVPVGFLVGPEYALHAAIAVLPFASPRLVNQAAKGLGFSDRYADRIADFANSMDKAGKLMKIPQWGARSGTIGALWTTLVEAKQAELANPDILTNMGRTGLRTHQSTQVMR